MSSEGRAAQRTEERGKGKNRRWQKKGEIFTRELAGTMEVDHVRDQEVENMVASLTWRLRKQNNYDDEQVLTIIKKNMVVSLTRGFRKEVMRFKS